MEKENINIAELSITITNEHGLHARPADLFVRCANGFESVIKISNVSRNAEKKVNAKSILGLLSIGVHSGDNVHIVADGPDSEAAINALKELISSNFKE